MSENPIHRVNAALEGRYRIVRQLGEGGMAAVYLAEDLRHERKVAIKVLKPELAAVVGAERFLAEIEVTAGLQHPHILPLFDSGEAEGFLFYVMPYVEGESLRERLDREGELPVREAVRIVGAVAMALGYAHRQGVIHRDVKPENILLQDGQPVVADFGIALAVSHAGGGRLTETGMSLGTPHYMSPEQATAERAPGPGADIYALGCVLYEMLTGEPPYTGGSAQAILGKIITAEPVRPAAHRPSVPPHVEAVVLRSLEKIPADRFEAAEDLAGALEDESFRHGAVGGEAATATSPTWRTVALAAGALSVVLAGFLVQSVTSAPETPVRRFSIHLDRPARGGIAISPDGSKLVYRDSTDAVWLRDLSTLSETRISEETRGRPVFSPSGDRVLLYSISTSPAALQVVPIDEGAPRVVSREGGGLGSIWTADDQVLAVSRSWIRRIDAATGDTVTVRVADQEAGEVFAAAAPLPEGTHVLLERRLPSGSSIVRMRAEDGTFEEILVGRTPRYAGGFLFFVGQDDVLQAVPYDPHSGEVRGAPVQIAEGLYSEWDSYDVSEAGVLVYQLRGGSSIPPELVQLSRDGTDSGLDLDLPEGARPDFVALSPDSGKVAYGTGTETWVQDLGGGQARRLGRSGDATLNPRWSRDGAYVYFVVAERGMTESGALFRQRADLSRPPELVLRTGRGIHDFALGSGVDTVALMFEMGTEDGDLGWVDLTAGSDPVLLTDAGRGDEHSPMLSPDGRWLAYQTNDSGATEVYVVDFPAARTRIQVSVDGGRGPAWSPDGRELFYWDRDDVVWSVRVATDPSFESLERTALFSAQRFGATFASRFRTPYSAGPEPGTLLFADPGRVEPGETIVVLNVFRELAARVRGGS